MLNQDYTAKLLNLEDVIITNVENIYEELHIYIELPRKEHTCPVCGAVTDRVHDYRMQTVKDVPLARNTFLHLRKRRYRCDCGKRFFEHNTFLPRYYRATSRLVVEIIRAFEKVVSAKEIGCRFNVSGTTVMRYFRCVNHKTRELPEVLSLDEFKGNSGGEKYNSIVADPQNHKVIDILPNRYENDLIKYFSQFESRKNVKYFVCDMNPHFRQVGRVCFKNAVIVADRYHVIRQVYWAMVRVRKEEQKRLSAEFRKHFNLNSARITTYNFFRNRKVKRSENGTLEFCKRIHQRWLCVFCFLSILSRASKRAPKEWRLKLKNPNKANSKPNRIRPEYRSHTGPPAQTEKPVCTATPLCEGCPFPSHGFLCQGGDGECMRTRLMKLSEKEEPK